MNIWKKLIKESTVCSSIRQVFADDITFFKLLGFGGKRDCKSHPRPPKPNLPFPFHTKIILKNPFDTK